jgi:type VI secretion system FHA domain protein
MALKLTILSEQREQLGPLASIVFGVGGGGIGRANDNDWVLPDPQRYLSAHHARIQFRAGSFLLLDTSTNGVYVNDGTMPIGRRGSHSLRDGDVLRFGNYEVSVTIDMEPPLEAQAPEASAIFSVSAQPSAAPTAGARHDIGASLNVRDLLNGEDAPSSSSNSRMRPHGAFGQAPLTEDTALLAFDSGLRSAPSRPRSTDRALERLTAIEAFCRGAGIDAKDLTPEAPARLLQLAGVLLREALVGLKGLALSQREIREQTHIEVGKEDLQHIGLTGLPVEDLLLRLLLGHERHDLDAVQWVREMLSSTRRHDVAMMTALQRAFADFIARVEPRALVQTDARGDTAAVTDWSALSARFRSITDAPAGSLPHLFVESFARAFVAAYRQNGSEASRN